MADNRDNENQDEPKIKIVDSRLLSDEERAGKGAAPETETERPKLEIIGGGGKSDDAPKAEPQAGSTPDTDDAHELSEEEELSPEEREQMREQVENEQFAALEQQMGRPLTAGEKEQVREEMKKQAEQISRLEVEPMLVQMMAEMSARAAVHLGLMPNPYTRLVARNDTQARLAIDSYGAIYEVIKNQLDENTRREFERVLTDLRVNFSSITGTPATNFPGSGGFSGPRIIH
jgi:hypothetical protein